MTERLFALAPALFGVLALALWEGATRLFHVPVYLIPGPIAVVGAFLQDPRGLLLSLASTLAVTFAALAAAAVRGAAMAVAMSASRLLSGGDPALGGGSAGDADRGDRTADHRVGGRSVRVAGGVRDDRGVFPGVREYRDRTCLRAELWICFIYAAGATWRTLTLLRLPAALPFFLTGLRISGGLALVGAVVAEFVAGSGSSRPDWRTRILEAGYRFSPRMFAALVLLSLAGIRHQRRAGMGRPPDPAGAGRGVNLEDFRPRLQRARGRSGGDGFRLGDHLTILGGRWRDVRAQSRGTADRRGNRTRLAGRVRVPRRRRPNSAVRCRRSGNRDGDPYPGDRAARRGLTPVLNRYSHDIVMASRLLDRLSAIALWSTATEAAPGSTKIPAPAPSQPRGQRRLDAELAWSRLADRHAVDIFRLAGIYGTGRSAFDDLRAGTARRMSKPGHQFGRIHRDDIGRAVHAAMHRIQGRGRRVFNLADDVPAESAAVVTEAARLMGVSPPPEISFAAAFPTMSPMARSFWAENRKVSSRKTQQALGLRWLYPSFREVSPPSGASRAATVRRNSARSRGRGSMVPVLTRMTSTSLEVSLSAVRKASSHGTSGSAAVQQLAPCR